MNERERMKNKEIESKIVQQFQRKNQERNNTK